MALSKRTYTAGMKITAENLNAIQDEVIRIADQLGKDISSATIDSRGHLILTLTDGSTIDAGSVSGGSATVDDILSKTSENPVQNKVVEAAISKVSTDLGDVNVISHIDATACDAIAYTYSLINKMKSLPSVTTSDNGKVLRVVKGSWAASSLPNAEEVSF